MLCASISRQLVQYLRSDIMPTWLVDDLATRPVPREFRDSCGETVATRIQEPPQRIGIWNLQFLSILPNGMNVSGVVLTAKRNEFRPYTNAPSRIGKKGLDYRVACKLTRGRVVL